MKNKIDFSKSKYKIAVLLIFLLGSFAVFLIGRASTSDNKVAFKYVSMTSIKTGEGQFDSDDGLNYNSDGYTVSSGYIPGNDKNASNRIVRSFDTLSYTFNYELTSKNPGEDYTDRNVNIKVTLSDEEAKYVTFSPDEEPGTTTKTFTFTGRTVGYANDYTDTITLYVLGAPNGFEIDPSFEINESTNIENNYIVTLGKINDTHYYDYDSESSKIYSDKSSTNGFSNYMPSIVSSKTGNVALDIIGQSSEGQKTTYNGKSGRFLSYTLGIKMYGDSYKGIKGQTMPVGEINLPISFNSTGSEEVEFKNEWARLYGVSVGDGIENVVVDEPYSNSVASNNMKTKNPGTITFDGSVAKINNYAVTFKEATYTAAGNSIGKENHYFGTYAFSVFSSRTAADFRNDFNVTMHVSSSTVKDTNNADIIINESTSNEVTNNFYEVTDYNIKSEFTDEGGSKISKYDSATGNGSGALSKGTTFIYKSILNYKKTLSNQGLKEIFKIDTDAFRVISLDNEKDVRIKISGDSGLSEDDFEVKFVSGSFDASNYSINTDYSRISEVESDGLGTCPRNISNFNKDQIQNLYGGPCITVNENVEKIYESVFKAKTADDIEDPITKVIVQTKEGIVLPDNAEITIEVGLRVRNMLADITSTHQATVVAMSSDYDSELTYYAPRILNDGSDNSITSENNYNKTSYQGNSITSIDTEHPWGDSLKIVNFTSRETITVTNKNDDGSVKTDYSVGENKTINYKISTIIDDYNEEVGADDVWYIDHLKVYVNIPQNLIYVPNDDLGKPEVINNEDGSTLLIYTLPYTKPNQSIKDIYFNVTLNPALNGVSIPLTVTSTVEAININNEEDTSFFGHLSSSFTIYATELKNVLPTITTGEEGSVVEKNQEFSYIVNAHNTSGIDFNDYTLLDILPVNNTGDSSFDGSYEVKVIIPDNQGKAVVYCSTQDPKTLSTNPDDSKDSYSVCNITDDYEKVTAIKIKNIEIKNQEDMGSIIIKIKPSGNNYSNKYVNEVYGKANKLEKIKSNTSEVRVVSRSISGRVFVDSDEDGIEEDGDVYLSNLPVTLYSVSNGSLKKIAETNTNDSGYYKFKDLDEGSYKVRVNYPNSLYDLTVRYGTEDYVHDSDAYKILEDNQEVAEIAYIRTIDDQDRVTNSLETLSVTRNRESVENMNVGLISRQEFGFKINKYITKVDLTTNAGNRLLTYDNTKKVKLDVKNSLQATARVYYEIRITNDSTSSGYVKIVGEDIPNGLSFDSNDTYNSDWIDTNGMLQSIKYENELIRPGESKNLYLVLDMPRQETAATFINTATLLEIEEYIPESLTPDKDPEYKANYEIGEALTYGGVRWHVVGTALEEGGSQTLTLLADDTGYGKAHTNNVNNTYKWSDSEINKYLNLNTNNRNSWSSKNTINLSILNDNIICDDASGLPVTSNGGALQSDVFCQSNIFTTNKVRLLTETEYNNLLQNIANSNDFTWLYNNGNSDYNFWLMNADSNPPESYDAYGVPTNSARIKAKYVNVSSQKVETGSASQALRVRPVIVVSSKNIIAE